MPKDTEIGDAPAVYIRKSTDDQSDAHQYDDIKRWLDYQEISVGEIMEYTEQGSGAADREQFRQLIDDIQAGGVSDVIVWAIDRIARNGLLAQEFFEACEDANVTIHVTNGSVRRVEPDGDGRMVAGIIAEVAAEERRRLIERTESGMRRAREEGKWLGGVPAGFVRDDGYLRPNLNPDYNDGETGFFDVAASLEAIEDGRSYRDVAQGTPNISRQTLSNIDNDPERKSWYLDREADDDRVSEALSSIDGSEGDP